MLVYRELFWLLCRGALTECKSAEVVPPRVAEDASVVRAQGKLPDWEYFDDATT